MRTETTLKTLTKLVHNFIVNENNNYEQVVHLMLTETKLRPLDRKIK